MSSMHVLQLPASPAAAGLTTSWTLARDRAITFDARRPGYLRVARGALWATLEGPHVQGAANDWGDQVLRCCARIRLVPGQQVVLESYPDAANEEAVFTWEPEESAPSAPEAPAARAWRSVRARATALVHALGYWLEPGPAWPRLAPDMYTRQREEAWRTLFHLGINQP